MRVAAPVKAWAQRFAFLLLVGGAFALMLLGKADTVLVERTRTALTDAVAPVMDLASRPIATVGEVVREGRELAHLRSENAALRRENDRLLHWQTVARRLEARNEALAALLNVVPEPGVSYVTARVVADRGGAFVRSVLVNAGRRHGVEKGQAALAGEGLAGRVAEAGRNSARVLLITDINSRIPVRLQEAGHRAVLAGDNSERPRLVFLPREAAVEPGARVVTSGHGGLFPPGLPVGRVVAAGEAGVRVEPFVDWDAMDYLRLADYEAPGLLRAEGEGAEAAGTQAAGAAADAAE